VAELPVFHEARWVGTVQQRADGPWFSYDPEWLGSADAFPISVQMPLSASPTPPGVFQRWATGLLPRGARLAALARQLGLAPNDSFGILVRMGRDTAGALSFGEPASLGAAGLTAPIGDDAVLAQLLEELPRSAVASGEDALSAVLGGAACKLPVAVNAAGCIRLPRDGAPSTHILKPDAEHLFGGVQNEALCLVLARRCGLSAPAVTTGIAGRRAYLLVQRYDRVACAGGWHRLHQETFAQALGLPVSDEREAPPAFAELLALSRRHMRACDVLALIDACIFDALICNPDASADSLSVMLGHDGIGLAPLHGLACVAAWDGISPRLDRMIGGAHIGAAAWEAFAAECGLNAARLLKRVEALAGAVLAQTREAAAAVAAMPAGSHPLLPRLVEAIETRARRHRAVAEVRRLRRSAPVTLAQAALN
jgi:serine/threonine-protein kinase HipA